MTIPIPKNKSHQPRLAVTYRRIDELKPNPKNPRVHSDRHVKQIAASMQTFGNNMPVAIDRNDMVIAGHGRLLAAKLLGLHEVPVIRLEHLTEAQAKAFMVADNKLTDNSTWDDRLLEEAFDELSAMELDFSLEATGFTMAEIDLRIEGLDDAGDDDKPDTADELPDLPNAAPVTHPGDLWLLDRHRLFCGNALEEADYDKLMDGAKAAMIFADVPYNVKIDGHASGLGTIKHREFAMASGEMNEAEFTAFLMRACSLMALYSVDGSSIHFVCMDWRHAGELLAAGKSVYTKLKNICVWAKDNAGMGSLYRSQHEFVFVFKHGRAPHRNNVQLGQYGRYRTNVWKYPGCNSFSRKTDEGDLLAMHATVKPVAMVADAILDVTARGEIVLDPFLGSGTTLMAAERVGRICHGMEIDPLYVDTAIRRWQKYTGDKAMHAASGKSFDEIAAETEAQHGG